MDRDAFIARWNLAMRDTLRQALGLLVAFDADGVRRCRAPVRAAA
jgi:hypothetical protein